MPPRNRKPAAASSAPGETPTPATEKPATAVYRYEQLVGLPEGHPSLPGEDTAAVMAAINAGFRPIGTASVDRTEDRDGATLVVWSVPIQAG